VLALPALALHLSQLGNPRLPVPNEYLAGWALTQNDTACLERFQEMGYSGESREREGVCRFGVEAMHQPESTHDVVGEGGLMKMGHVRPKKITLDL